MLIDFIELPRRRRIFDERGTRIDRFRLRSSDSWEPHAISKYPALMALSETLEYDPLQFDLRTLRERYNE